MKKKYISILIILLFSISTKAQTATNVVTGLNQPFEFVLNGNNLYIAEYNKNKISKINLFILSINTFNTDISFSLYPNPSNKFIQISGLTAKEEYKIYDILSAEVKNGNRLKFIKNYLC